MGCSAGLVARDLLPLHPDSLALVVSTENITQNWYPGDRRDMLIPNCLFRVGAAAPLLSNRRRDLPRAKYRLLHLVRTHLGADDRAFSCVRQEQDDAGVSLSKDLMAVAANALRSNITSLGPLVLPLSEQLLFLLSHAARRLLRSPRIHPYVPDFKRVFDHFCIHAGGCAVIDELERSLRLRPDHVEASRMALRFGNTSSSSIWYELAYPEAKCRVRRRHRVWQIAFGSGFKCNSAVWQTCRDIKPTPNCNPWLEFIDEYPVELVDGVDPRITIDNNDNFE